VCLDMLAIFDSGKTAQRLHTEVPKLAQRWLSDVELRLQDREWIACADFTAADIMLAGVLRTIRKTDLLQPFPRLRAYFERCQARPAWQRTLRLSAERLGVNVDDIR
jgi:glutathione S-transferase